MTLKTNPKSNHDHSSTHGARVLDCGGYDAAFSQSTPCLRTWTVALKTDQTQSTQKSRLQAKIKPKSNRFKPKKWQRHRHHVGSYPPFPPHASRHTPSAYHCRLLPAIASLPATENSGFFPLQKPSNHWANPQKTPKKTIKKSCKYVRPTIHVSINPLIHPMLDAPRLSTLNSPNSQPFTLPPD